MVTQYIFSEPRLHMEPNITGDLGLTIQRPQTVFRLKKRASAASDCLPVCLSVDFLHGSQRFHMGRCETLMNIPCHQITTVEGFKEM